MKTKKTGMTAAATVLMVMLAIVSGVGRETKEPKPPPCRQRPE